MPWNSNGNLLSELKTQKTFLWLTVPSYTANSKWPKALSFVLNQNPVVCQMAFVTIYDSLKTKLNFISRSKGLPTKFCQRLSGFLSQIPPHPLGQEAHFMSAQGLQSLPHWCLVSTPTTAPVTPWQKVLIGEKFLNMWSKENSTG